MAARKAASGSDLGRARLSVAARAITATLGGYALAAAGALLLKRLPGDPRALAQGADLLFFPLMAAAVVWTFAAADLRRACGWTWGAASLLWGFLAVLGGGA